MSSSESQTVTQTFDEEESHRQYAMQLVSASVLPMVLKSAIELGVLEIIAKAGPGALLSPSEIATRLQTNNPEAPLVLDRILCLLASYSILTCSLSTQCNDGQQEVNSSSSPSSRLYGLAPVSKYFIPNQDGVSLAPMLHVIQDKVTVNMWYHLKDAVMEGGLPFNRAYGMNSCDYVRNDPRWHDLFKASTGDYNTIFMKQILETYKGFKGLNLIVDVGGGHGAVLSMIVSKYPTIKGINFDLTPVIEKTKEMKTLCTKTPKILFDPVKRKLYFLKQVLSIPKGDSIFLKWILHSCDDENCLKILKNCYDSLPDNVKVIVVDMVIPETPETSVDVKSDFQFDLFLMNMNPGGKESTEREFESLAKEAGFSRVSACAFKFSLVEFYKTT